MSEPVHVVHHSGSCPGARRNQLADAVSQDPGKLHRKPRRSSIAWHADANRRDHGRALDRTGRKLAATNLQGNSSEGQDGGAKAMHHHPLQKRDAVDLQRDVQADIVANGGSLQQSPVSMRQAWKDQRYFLKISKANSASLEFGAGRGNQIHLLVQDRDHFDPVQRHWIVQDGEIDAPLEKPFFQRRADAFTDQKRCVRPILLERCERSLAR